MRFALVLVAALATGCVHHSIDNTSSHDGSLMIVTSKTTCLLGVIFCGSDQTLNKCSVKGNSIDCKDTVVKFED